MMKGKETGAGEPGGAEVETEQFIDKKEVARRTRIHPRTINVWMKNGNLPYYKIGRFVRFKWSEVEKHLAARCRVDSEPAVLTTEELELIEKVLARTGALSGNVKDKK